MIPSAAEGVEEESGMDGAPLHDKAGVSIKLQRFSSSTILGRSTPEWRLKQVLEPTTGRVKL